MIPVLIEEFPRTVDLMADTARQPANESIEGSSRLSENSASCEAEVEGLRMGARSPQGDGMVPEESSGPRWDSSHETPAQAAMVESPGLTRAPVLAPPSSKAKQSRDKRLCVLRAINDMIAQEHCTISAACLRVGINQATYTRWRDAFQSEGEEGLLDGHYRSGRKSSWGTYVQPADEEWLIARLRFLNGKCGDASTATKIVADEPECPPALASYLRTQRRFPLSLLRKAAINPQIRSKFKGARNYQLNSIFNLRTMTEIINGAEVPIQPGDWWELDDMSLNQPFWFEIPAGDHDGWRGCTVDGIALGRQGLYCMDICSGKWLGHMLVGRPRDAYRAEDILRYLRGLMEVWGKPRRGLRLERGIWRSRRIVGYKLSAYGDWDAEQVNRPGMADAEQDALVAGIKSLGIEVVYCYSPHQKGFIEGGFNILQRYMSSARSADIGRHRGEGEAATKALISAKQGRTHPAAKGFWHIEQASAGLTWAESWLNTHRKDGRLQFGIPDERWVAAQSRFPMQPLARDDQAVFLPERRELQVRGGHVTPEFAGQPFPFIAPELFAEIGNTYRLLIAFDPSNPQLGAALWNRETGMANRRGWKVGEFLGWADYEPPCPQFGVRPGEDTRDNRKRYQNWHRTEFTAIKDFGGQAKRESAARDGCGNAVELTRDAVPVTSAAPVRPARPAREAAPKTPALNTSLLARQAALARRMFEEED